VQRGSLLGAVRLFLGLVLAEKDSNLLGSNNLGPSFGLSPSLVNMTASLRRLNHTRKGEM